MENSIQSIHEHLIKCGSEYRGGYFSLVSEVEIKQLIEFHVTEALNMAAENARVESVITDYIADTKEFGVIPCKTQGYVVNKDSILNSYDLNLIK